MKHLIRLIAIALLAGGAAQAQTYPTKPVRIIVPFAPGGGADIFARLLGEHLQQAMGQAFVVDNRPGAGGLLGAEAAAKAPADGYTLLMATSTHSINETLAPNRAYKLMRDFVPVAPVNYADLLLVVSPTLPVNSLRELIDLAKARPGALNYASTGPGTPLHLAGEMLRERAGIDIVHVPYRAGGNARIDILNGQISFMFDTITNGTPMVRANQVRGLAVTGPKRSSALPEMPTMAEAGMPDFVSVALIGIMAPAGTPRPIVERLNAEISRVAAKPEVVKTWAGQGAEPLILSPDAWGNRLQADIDQWAKVIGFANIKVE